MTTSITEGVCDHQKPKTGKAWVVMFFDGNGGLSHLHTFSFDSDMAAINKWAKDKIASEKAIFWVNPYVSYNRTISHRYVVYGTEVETLNLPKLEAA